MSTAEKLAEALDRVKFEAVSLADAQVIALEALAEYRAKPAADGAQRVDRMSEEQMTCVNTPMDEFEDAIRRVGVVAACEWFGHHSDSEFTKETIRVLAQRATPTPEAS